MTDNSFTKKHTQGPWKAGRSDMASIVDGIEAKWVYDQNGRRIAMASIHDIDEWDEVIDNARLIAAAPDLLEALRNLCEVSGRSRNISAAREKAQEAIAKAEGRE